LVIPSATTQSLVVKDPKRTRSLALRWPAEAKTEDCFNLTQSYLYNPKDEQDQPEHKVNLNKNVDIMDTLHIQDTFQANVAR